MRTLDVILCVLLAALAAEGATDRLWYAVDENSPVKPFSEHLHICQCRGSADGPVDGVSTNAIFGGSDLEDINLAPYHAALIDASRGFICSATIIGESWVITAAHCVDGSQAEITVMAGTLKLQPDDNEQVQRIPTQSGDRFVYPQFNIEYLDNDIALIKLPQNLQFTRAVEAALLPTWAETAISPVNQLMTITGWGRVGDTGPQVAPTLQYSDINISDDSVCKEVYGMAMIGTKMCAATTASSTCTGDSGGPVVTERRRRSHLYGIISSGSKSGCTVGRPIIFTKITAFLEFIENTTGLVIRDNDN